jgi:hypothetical protein
VAQRQVGRIAPRDFPGADVEAVVPVSSGKPTDLWINVVNEINGTEDGFGGQSRVHVETKKNLDAKKAYESWVADWRSVTGRKTKEDWLKKFKPEERPLALQLANEATTPDDISNTNMKSLLVHEIGHALGLVPKDDKAGGIEDLGWEDSGHPGHCRTNACVMFWTSGSAQLGLAAQLRESAPYSEPGQ